MFPNMSNFIPTKILYLNSSSELSCTAELLAIGEDERGVFVVLDQTVFYPQGGGQPADHGVFLVHEKTSIVQDVRRVEGEIRHYCENVPEQLRVRDHVICLVDGPRRKLNTLYHSAGHLIGSLVEQLAPRWQAVKGHAFPGQAYVECVGSDVAEGALTHETLAPEALNTALMGVVARALPVRAFECELNELPQGAVPVDCPTGDSTTVRVVQMGDFPPIPCGGTHVSSTGDLASDQLKVRITKCKTRDGRLRVSYEVTCASPV